MIREEKLDEALRTMDFYELAKLTYERGEPMKINIKQTKSEEMLQRFGNKFFTKEQIKALRGA